MPTPLWRCVCGAPSRWADCKSCVGFRPTFSSSWTTTWPIRPQMTSQLAGDGYASADDAVEALQIAEFLRRSADAITVQVMDDVAGSSVVDEHGHASVRAMYDTATSQSSRDLYGLEQVRKMFRKCPDIKAAAYNADLSWEHLRLLARVYANRRVRSAFIDQQGWFLRKAGRFDFRRFEILVNRWEEVSDPDGPEPDDAFVKRTASATQDHFSRAWHRTSTHSPQIGAAMADVENVYIEAEFAKDWEAAKAIHGDKTCKAEPRPHRCPTASRCPSSDLCRCGGQPECLGVIQLRAPHCLLARRPPRDGAPLSGRSTAAVRPRHLPMRNHRWQTARPDRDVHGLAHQPVPTGHHGCQRSRDRRERASVLHRHSPHRTADLSRRM